jgi:hypothetical protein
MIKAHKQTQSDFKGAKKTNLVDFRDYLSEAMRGERFAYLPAVAAWQAEEAFDETVFVAAHESGPGAYYGQLFVPDKPIMQADGQTQTAALFAADVLGMALQEREHFFVSIEIELKVSERSAAQSFVDRNGRGTKKNKNLVANYNTVDGLPTLRANAVKGTIFDGRLHDGKNSGTGENSTENIIDLSTLEQLCLMVVGGGGSLKAEHIKGYHVEALTPFVHDFHEMLDRVFGSEWPRKIEEGEDPYRRVYVHGWPFALKAIAQAYFESRQKEIAPFYEAIRVPDVQDATEETQESYHKRVDEKKAALAKEPEPPVSAAEVEVPVSAAVLEDRLSKIDWRRTRTHWMSITGYPTTQAGKAKTKKLADGSAVVVGNAPNTKVAISAVKNKLLSDSWTELTGKEDFPVPTDTGNG